MVKLSDFINSPWHVTTHTPTPVSFGISFFYLQWLVKNLLVLAKKVSVVATVRVFLLNLSELYYLSNAEYI